MSTEIDGFEIAHDDPLAMQQRRLSALLVQARPVQTYYYDDTLSGLGEMEKLQTTPAAELPDLLQSLIFRHAFNYQRMCRLDPGAPQPHDPKQRLQWEWDIGQRPEHLLALAVQLMSQHAREWNLAASALVLNWVADGRYLYRDCLKAMVNRLEAAAAAGLDEPTKAAALRAIERINADPYTVKDHALLAERIERALGLVGEFPLVGDEDWTAAALGELSALSADRRTAWANLLVHCRTATSANPTAKWLKTARGLLTAVGDEDFLLRTPRWISQLEDGKDPGRIATMNEYRHNDIARGLAWCAGFYDDDALRQALTTAVLRVNLPFAPGSVFATAAAHSLGAMPNRSGLGALAVLKSRVRRRTTLAQIDKAFRAAAERAGMTPDEIEEACVPTCGFTEVGRLTEPCGDFTAELTVDGLKTSLAWVTSTGKRQASVPAAVKTEHAESLKELKAAAKEVDTLLPAIRDRLDGLFRVERQWLLSAWRERYGDHPLTGIVARRLIWEFDEGGERRPGLYHEGRFIDVDGRPFEPGEQVIVRLWHPIGRSAADVVAWRERLEACGVRQPLKQAHREIYLLTDAERQTAMYSNRFAAHIVRQQQFNALCAARRWHHHVRVANVSETTNPSVSLPSWNLRVEYWVEVAGGHDAGDTNEMGSFLYLTTDQVRFYPLTGATGTPLALETVPALPFSEVMRDVDLFVGVAGVAGDPTWSDGGPNGRFRDHWQSVAFGELTASAQTRREVLERLIPRLKIADRCTFEDRFLVVRGDLRTYKIHFGSANILMAPNDEYLCIVADRSPKAMEKVFLPFDGDERLSILLSKALLLADDKKITDPSIVHQIARK